MTAEHTDTAHEHTAPAATGSADGASTPTSPPITPDNGSSSGGVEETSSDAERHLPAYSSRPGAARLAWKLEHRVSPRSFLDEWAVDGESEHGGGDDDRGDVDQDNQDHGADAATADGNVAARALRQSVTAANRASHADDNYDTEVDLGNLPKFSRTPTEPPPPPPTSPAAHALHAETEMDADPRAATGKGRLTGPPARTQDGSSADCGDVETVEDFVVTAPTTSYSGLDPYVPSAPAASPADADAAGAPRRIAADDDSFDWFDEVERAEQADNAGAGDDDDNGWPARVRTVESAAAATSAPESGLHRRKTGRQHVSSVVTIPRAPTLQIEGSPAPLPSLHDEVAPEPHTASGPHAPHSPGAPGEETPLSAPRESVAVNGAPAGSNGERASTATQPDSGRSRAMPAANEEALGSVMQRAMVTGRMRSEMRIAAERQVADGGDAPRSIEHSAANDAFALDPSEPVAFAAEVDASNAALPAHSPAQPKEIGLPSDEWALRPQIFKGRRGRLSAPVRVKLPQRRRARRLVPLLAVACAIALVAYAVATLLFAV